MQTQKKKALLPGRNQFTSLNTLPGSHLFHFHEESLSATISVIFLLYLPQNCGNQEEGQETTGKGGRRAKLVVSYLVMLVLFQFYCAKSCINNSVFGPCHSPLENVSVFGRVNRASEGMGRPRGLERFRKTHLENYQLSGFWDRDPRYLRVGHAKIFGAPQRFWVIWKNFRL